MSEFLEAVAELQGMSAEEKVQCGTSLRCFSIGYPGST